MTNNPDRFYNQPGRSLLGVAAAPRVTRACIVSQAVLSAARSALS